MKKISLLLLLATTGSVLVAEKSELQKHNEALEEVVKHIDDIWYEESTVNSHTANPQIGIINGSLGAKVETYHTTSTVKKIFFNTPDAGKAYHKYLKALSPLEWDILKKDLITSIATGIASGLAFNPKKDSSINGLALVAPLVVPTAEIIATNLSKDPMKYFNSRTLSIHDNLYGNLSWKTFGRIFGHVAGSYASMGLTTALTN